mmetsp:Transcript_9344/g.20807  ORF Transcript_9344/g.20807 Transcript_9344/m.20807 type:complete len:364 (-) Transcript_9344:110-1201(-)
MHGAQAEEAEAPSKDSLLQGNFGKVVRTVKGTSDKVAFGSQAHADAGVVGQGSCQPSMAPASPEVACSDVTTAADLRTKGNELFRVGWLDAAAGTYREAYSLLQKAAPAKQDESDEDLREQTMKAVRLNLATCLVRLSENLGEAVRLCDEALLEDSNNAKALFLRGSAARQLADSVAPSESSQRRELLIAARKDLVQATRLSPGDRQVRALLANTSEALQAMPPVWKPGSLFGSGLYDDRKPAPPPPPPVVCVSCGRVGHPCCGRLWWVEQRAKWLGLTVDEVDQVPTDFEDDGPLRAALMAAGHRSAEGQSPAGVDAELSQEDWEALEECLDSWERPFPSLKGRVTLPQAVRCAVNLWANEA